MTAVATKAAPAKKSSPKATEKVKGLTKPQQRLLEAMCKAKGPMTAALLSEKAGVARSWIGGHVNKAGAANTVPSLVEQGLARRIELEVEGRKEVCYEPTAKGRKASSKS